MTLRLRVLSDLHFEFHMDSGGVMTRKSTRGDFDVLVLAGDISSCPTLHRSIQRLAKAVAPRPVVYTLGNHELYGGSLGEALEEVRQVQRDCPNVHFLELGTTTIQGQRFIGCTLWYEHPIPLKEDRDMGDFAYIEGTQTWLHDKAKASAKWLRDTIQPGDVVVTHFVPHVNSIAPQWATSPLNHYFVHNVGDIVEHGEAKLWIHGHTHSSFDYVVGKTRVVCNPFGYVRSRLPREPNPDFDQKKTVEV